MRGGLEVELVFKWLDKRYIHLLEPEVIFTVIQIQCWVVFLWLFLDEGDVLSALELLFEVEIIQ